VKLCGAVGREKRTVRQCTAVPNQPTLTYCYTVPFYTGVEAISFVVQVGVALELKLAARPALELEVP